MGNLLGNRVESELIFVYGLIALVIILIITIVIIDRVEAKKKQKSLFDTLNMKAIKDSYIIDNHEKEQTPVPEIIEFQKREETLSFQDMNPIPEVKTTVSSPALEEIEENADREDDLEKTQAQIRVEEITNALRKAQMEEQIQEDKYQKFEEEQEKNAIISYSELKESYDRLYSENEKTQYLEDDEIPINIDELYKMEKEKSAMKEEKEVPKQNNNTTFKSSPLISPVYGIQEPPSEQNAVDMDIQNANHFLQNLKELKKNLD